MTFLEVIDNFRALRQDPGCSGYLDGLVDLSSADLLLDTNQLRTAAEEISVLRDKARFGLLAIVAPRDAMFGMMRMFEVFAKRYFREIRVFRALEEAERWLTSEPAAIDPES
jgi:hypothetical protein